MRNNSYKTYNYIQKIKYFKDDSKSLLYYVILLYVIYEIVLKF